MTNWNFTVKHKHIPHTLFVFHTTNNLSSHISWETLDSLGKSSLNSWTTLCKIPFKRFHNLGRNSSSSIHILEVPNQELFGTLPLCKKSHGASGVLELKWDKMDLNIPLLMGLTFPTVFLVDLVNKLLWYLLFSLICRFL